MAETFSVERRRLMRFLGAKVVLTPGRRLAAVGMLDKTKELAAKHGWFMTRQFENEANPDMHSRTTAREIVDDFAGEKLDYWVTGFGTGGTLKGVARVLAKERPDTKIIVCEPEDAPMLSSGEGQPRNPDGTPAVGHTAWKPHPMQGWSPDFIPKLTADAVDMKLDPPDRPHPRPRRAQMQPRPRAEGGDLCRHHLGRDLCRRAQGLRGGTAGLDRPVHAARHRRALSVDAPFRRYPAGDERRGNGDFAVDPRLSVPGDLGCGKNFLNSHPGEGRDPRFKRTSGG